MKAHRIRLAGAQHFAEGELSGASDLDLAAIEQEITPGCEVDTILVSQVLELAIRKLHDGELNKLTSLDQWLAPRVHASLRIPTRVASDSGFWTWLTLKVGRQYMWERWADDGELTRYRYTGDFKRNALARLWWFAEMSRSGPDYSAIEAVLRDASTAQYAMELRYSMYRPAVIAFGIVAVEKNLSFGQLKQLSKRINAYLSVHVLEVIGLDVDETARDATWWGESPGFGEMLATKPPLGPRDNFAAPAAITALVNWFNTLHAQDNASKAA